MWGPFCSSGRAVHGLPLAFFSKKLEAAQQKYSAFDRVLLVAYLAVRHFRSMLHGREFSILSDHKPLSFAIDRVSEPWSARQQRQLAFISEFTGDIQYLPRKDCSLLILLKGKSRL
jgi:hypothetical protein